ncbi:MAG: bifunctional glutamate N-acetyltransferase/amino-acid acetyltransferase ArgJ [Actinobacteria bacterium]|nr:bifunctional glutamate N-acetyltransferase/amino-acid acetyltransferase ArgJ [Actinomycetota bacterium]
MSVTAAKGFEASGVACGIKPSGAPDLALITTSDRCAVSAAGVFTQNVACAAPVQISRRHLEDGRAAAVVLSSGNANAATGEQGRQDALRMCQLAAEGLGCDTDDVLVCSTGLIGIPMPMAALEEGVPKAAIAVAGGSEAGDAAARGIMTTDTVSKQAVATASLSDGTTITVGGMAKGAAMLAPSMATMLAVLTTDASIESDVLGEALVDAVDGTFNALVVDACTSTNDTVLVLANGAAGNALIEDSGADLDAVASAITSVCDQLAGAMASDAEGATKLVTLTVTGAPSNDDARKAARKVASSQLVQCSLYGCDPYWGRIISELGTSGVKFDPEQVTISYNGMTPCVNGIAASHDEAALAKEMAGRDIEITCDLHAGEGTATMRFTDLTHAYIDENTGTS